MMTFTWQHFISMLTIVESFRLVKTQIHYKTTTTYTGNTSIIDCPIPRYLTRPYWRGPPGNMYYYYSGSTVVNPALGEKQNRTSLDQDQRTLLLTDTKFSDSGTYYCQKVIGPYSYRGYHTVSVRILPNGPDITTSVKEDGRGVLATEGQTLTVTCTSRGGYPVPTVRWYMGNITGKLLAQINTGTRVGGTYTVMLNYTFRPTRKDDRQTLMCQSYYPTPVNLQGSLEKNISLYLYLEPSSHTVSQADDAVSGSDVNVICMTIGSRPATSISWIYRGQTYTPAVSITEDPITGTFTVKSLFQQSVTAGDNGQTLQCISTHKVSSGTASLLLNVNFPVTKASTSITGNQIIVANGTNPLKLNCTTGSSSPASNITWRKGSDDITNNVKYIETPGQHNGRVRSQVLVLYVTRLDDGLSVSCSVSNGISQVKDETSVPLHLQYPPLIDYVSLLNATEGDSQTLACVAKSKPPASFTWSRDFITLLRGDGTSAYNGLDYTIDSVNKNHAGNYSCTADNTISPQDDMTTTLTVLYPPDVSVAATNTTIHASSATIVCHASGVPDQYTYMPWMHTWYDRVIPESLPGQKILNLTKLTYANSGVYTCSASNGVKDVSQGSVYFLVKSHPIVTDPPPPEKSITVSGLINRPVTTAIDFYSNSWNTYVTLYRGGNEMSNVSVVFTDVTVSLPIFTSNTKTPGSRATLNVTLTDQSQFGMYKINLKNEIGMVNLSLHIRPYDPPSTPTKLTVHAIDHQSLNVSWISESDSGLEQTFVIHYTTDLSIWRYTHVMGGMPPHKRHVIIDALVGNQIFFVRMLSKNAVGESDLSTTVNTTTHAFPCGINSSKQSSVTGAVAGSVSCVTIILIIAVASFVVRRYRTSDGCSSTKRNKPRVAGKNKAEVIGTNDATSPHSLSNELYEDIGPRHENGTNVYEQIRQPKSKPEATYENTERKF